MKIKLIFVTSILLVFTACKKEEETTDAKDFTKSTFQKVILPLHSTFSNKALALQSSVLKFETAPTAENLNSLKQNWQAAYSSYSPTEVFNIDNIKDNYAHLYFQKFPIDTLKVISNVHTNPSNAIVSSNAKGLGAIEYLLFRSAALDSFQNEANNIVYLKAMTNDIVDKGNELLSMWKENQNKYVNNQESDASNAFNQLVNGMIQFTENLKMLKVGNPLGKQSLDHPDHYLAQAPFSNTSETGLNEDFEILVKLWNGNKTTVLDTSVGLGEIVKAKNAEVYQEVNTILEKIGKDLSLLPDDLNTAFENMDEALNTLYEDLNVLYTLLKVDVSAQLDVTVFISDLDGD
ncbi:Predicted lipoprotein [Lishizhenia tianjinensis]|uniref:Predicted lipoprotein n=1 Tax=Lishizhenia tianjinensis TaxID=477690 RepID=A0A1I6YA09_9FLAO|nr:imelysin family protein [Lishizhenia tianjinensis]SFT47091.1 Predicted lipoprotein [Lishizhenia tianjinensis]